MSSHHWKSLDKNCPVSFNVYGDENAVVFPLFLSITRGMKPYHVHVLLSKGHYFLIRNLAALVSPQMKVNHHKCYIYPSCLGLYISECRYKTHLSLCRNDSLLSFTTFKNMVSTLFVIYSDLETCIEEEEVVKRGKVVSRCHHVPISVAALTVCIDRLEFGSKPFIYTARNCVDVLLDYLDHEVNHLREIYENIYEPCRWGEEERQAHWYSHSCAMCGCYFGGDVLKV